MEGFMVRIWDSIPPGYGGTLASAQALTLPARWPYQPQSINDLPIGVGFPHNAGRYRTEGSPFSSPDC